MVIKSLSAEQRRTLTEEYRSGLVISHLELRRTIGFAGISLPFVLIGGAWVFYAIRPQISFSAYYNTAMHDLSVGLMCFLSGFLWSYRGYDRRDEVAGKLASVFGWLSAIFPLPDNPAQMKLLALFHNILATVFFLILVYFAFFLFTRSRADRRPTPQKLRRNRIYRICAVMMVLSLAAGLTLFHTAVFAHFHPLLWGEVLAIEAFGIAWFVKGEGILKDEERIR